MEMCTKCNATFVDDEIECDDCGLGFCSEKCLNEHKEDDYCWDTDDEIEEEEEEEE